MKNETLDRWARKEIKCWGYTRQSQKVDKSYGTP